MRFFPPPLFPDTDYRRELLRRFFQRNTGPERSRLCPIRVTRDAVRTAPRLSERYGRNISDNARGFSDAGLLQDREPLMYRGAVRGAQSRTCHGPSEEEPNDDFLDACRFIVEDVEEIIYSAFGFTCKFPHLLYEYVITSNGLYA